ncbi:LuxR family transcriptional regulator [Mycobacterium xenopi]|uniref:Transcriptional regulator n=1 Tax=Mycobacterium xenopi TaxID=1789 RepID=A0AAD1H147_MYCXE|nr:LuxR family transcriptional regulator [Mycobacterium xenopi]MDA3640256.1 sigma factor-like helix-turn-helix DNA-binding protein [Mycobacterium xenopi]MDA3658420.1 sigma factor-like helix-turn-helix DNA-binding protein [Mycobacterium xenopi]ORX16813.1 LuxR family transcriptional regulator [Mycobacterium xenopi]SPX78430.1 response regulator containing a CheY-like receiver domain and an HTH DNA-binding domain [Mycobacterium xenopi]BBU22556.1 transcriptional regulator [Mycobacterium xenopi]
MISGDPLTGREGELKLIRRALSGFGNYSGVIIAGAAGVGKTRLAREVLARAAAAGARTNWIVGTESARPLPLGAFAALLTDAMAEPLLSVRRLINTFVAQQHRGRVLIGVDDAHLLDGLSAHVVHQLASTRGARLVVTVRTGADEPDAVTALWKDELLTRLDLEPLSAAATRCLIETSVGGPVDARSAERFWKLTGGNALFLRQLVADQIAAGRMRQVAGVWMWDDDVAVSPSLSDMLGRRLRRMTPRVARVVDTLSQCEPLSVEVLCDLVRRRDLESAEQMRLVTVERVGDERVARLAHPLFGELRQATAGELHLSKVRGQLARRLAREVDRDMRATVRRALLTLHSDLDPDPKLYLEAARFSMMLLDPDSAERFAAAAAACGAPDAAPMRAMTLVLLGRGEQAEEALRAICGADREDRHRWSTIRAANLIWMLGRPREAAAILDGLAAAKESAAQRDARLAVEACIDAVSARCADAEEKAKAALCSQVLSDFHAMMASVALVMAMGALGHVDDLADVAERAVERAITAFESSPMRFWFGAVYARACRLTGHIDECGQSARRIADSARDVPGFAYANLAFLLGHASLVRGDLRSALSLLREARAGVEKHGATTGLRPASCFGLAEAHAKLGQVAAAEEALAEAQRFVPAEYLFMQTALSLATGWTLAAKGYLGEAIATAHQAATEARERGQPTHELACLQAAAQWGDASQASRARDLADELSLPLANTVARHAESLLSGDGEGLLAASSEYQAIGDRVAAADAAAQAAAVFTSRQHRQRGLYATATARELAAECAGLCTPALRTTAGLPLGGRQREVIELAIAGLSNREIAERLVMSVRTVEGHIYRACQRVGVNTRDELKTVIRASWKSDDRA